MKSNSGQQTLKQVTDSLDNILQKRNGGATNFRGIHFQVLYSCFLVLQELKADSEINSIQLEGIEDIDVHTSQKIRTDAEYIQLKSSINSMNAGDFWGLGVLQNFLEVYKSNPNSRFRLVYNMQIAKGNLHDLVNREKGTVLDEFWVSKLEKICQETDFVDFADKLTFEHHSTNELYTKIRALLYKEWKVNQGTEIQFLNALFYNILIWSKDRETVSKAMVRKLFQNIRDSFSKSPINKAIQNNWISAVSYQNNVQLSDDYYDGKSARPIHIAQGLPARRKIWERSVEKALQDSDIVVIKSSSGQGKSTLAWQVGYNLKAHRSIYQLSTCRDKDEANSVVEFLESRVFIGEVPLLIIDGLDSSVEAWSDLAERLKQIPVKILITTRQEDWFRFGADISRINLYSIDISLSAQEAKDIFEQFKRKKKTHAEIKDWQPIWEQVMDKGLLIEYTYLLTKGQMIHERLEAQIKYLHESKSSGAKIEILRMVSLADCLNIKLETVRLLNYIRTEIGFEQDRGLLLNELEKEYFLNFDGQYVEGLHPVRSNHLKDLLHRQLPLEDSLFNLLKIIDDKYKHDFFINAPFLLTNNKAIFYKGLANLLSEGEISDMVYALDGIMHGEPQRYWLSNRDLFDTAYNMGGIDLFSIATVPFTELNTLSEFSEILGEKGGAFQQLAELKRKLPKYSFENADLLLFANALKDKLAKRISPVTSYGGLEFLFKWYNELKLALKLPFVQTNIGIDDLINMEIREAKEYMLYFNMSNPAGFKKFTNDNKRQIISYLKVSTNSITIEEKDGDIFIEYLLSGNEVDKGNENSVSRIQVLYAFLPFYKKYCTEALLLPFPSEELISVVKHNSIKNLTPEAIGDKFDIHLNGIWRSIIQKNYQETSAYEWQKNIIEVREIAIDWAKAITTLIDSLLEGNTAKKERIVRVVDQIRIKLAEATTVKKAYPKYGKKYFEEGSNSKEENVISKWFASLSNINSQFLNILLPKEEHDRHVALINLKAVYLDLKDMQNAFREVENRTIPYFDSEKVCIKEEKCFERLYTTVQYYISQLPLENKRPLHVARKVIEDWWSKAKNEKLDKLKVILNRVEEDLDYEFVLPDKLIETDTLTYATFGILNFDFSDEASIFQLSINLADLAELSIDFYSIISIKDNIASVGARFTKNYFEVFQEMLLEGTHPNLDGLHPLPINIDAKTIETLSGINLPETSILNQNKENQYNALSELWKLSEYRTRLNKKSELEMDWLKRVETESKEIINKIVKEQNDQQGDFKEFIAKGLQQDFAYTMDDIMKQLFKTLKN
ncbi:hypothetical protein BAS06_15740 [Elizabethkingia miricola]|uniref:P-loop NTPase n=1 Tax=Elizabethkingia miricola TaxID=172045 RepID=UPI00099A88C0|nr:hypothetical protein [Elizabethkingia miricola]OPB86647.1 hypothetical protein BAS06_15740 [Elizabethkingia miricola]